MRPARSTPPAAVRIDVENEWAWCGERRLSLTPRAFAVLRSLVAHPGRLVTKDDLLSTVWREAVVSDSALASCIRDLRRELADPSGTPRYIETVHRRGFRFIGPVASSSDLPSGPRAARPAPEALPDGSTASPTLVGREAQLARLREVLASAATGRRRLVFVTGEPGIGKTALVDAFLSEIRAGETLPIGRGQCVEQYGAGEAYLPVLEALGRLGRGRSGERVVQVLRQDAPTWLMQLPALLADQDLEAVERRARGATRDRMLRELVEALDALSHDEPLVLVLEDLHWSDSSTIDLLARLARRPDPARLLMLGTYRPADLAAGAHPLKAVKQELEVHGHCEEMPLALLGAAAVQEYLSRRFPRHLFPSELAQVLHRNTGGNPLFVVNTVDDLITRRQVREGNGTWTLSAPLKDLAAEAPESLGQMVDRQVERLSADEQAVLAAASVAGAEFSAALVAADAVDAREAEKRCDALARRGQFLRATGVAEWPDGSVAGRYAFIHALYQQRLYARVPVTRRVALHRRTGERLERAYGSRAEEIAGELAVHFELGRDVERAVGYRRRAADRALGRHAYREAAGHATRALELLAGSTGAGERAQRELTLHVMLGTALTAMKGYSAPEVERTYARALELCGQVDDDPRLFPVLLGLGWFYLVRGPARAARDVARRLLAMAEATRDPAIALAAHNASGLVSFYEGEFEPALVHLEEGIALYDPAAHSPNRSPAFRGGLDPGLSCTCHAAWALWALGYPDRAAARMQEALALARSLDHPFTLAHACRFAATFHLSRGERDAVREHVDATLALSAEHGFRVFDAVAKFHQGWVLTAQGQGQEGLEDMRQWVAACRDIRADCLIPPYLGWLAEAYGKIGRAAEGLDLVNEALAAGEQSGYRYWSAELHRSRGMLTLEPASGGAARNARSRERDPARAGRRSAPAGAAAKSPAEQTAESCFLEAIEIARRQRAKLFELRAATSLGRLWMRQGKEREAHARLADVYNWFAEGLNTSDLVEGQLLLENLDAEASGRGRARPRARRDITRTGGS
jgi:predicted ATPase/DNA-binding winged helix-turn-helix (wHTH) protein